MGISNDMSSQYSGAVSTPIFNQIGPSDLLNQPKCSTGVGSISNFQLTAVFAQIAQNSVVGSDMINPLGTKLNNIMTSSVFSAISPVSVGDITLDNNIKASVYTATSDIYSSIKNIDYTTHMVIGPLVTEINGTTYLSNKFVGTAEFASQLNQSQTQLSGTSVLYSNESAIYCTINNSLVLYKFALPSDAYESGLNYGLGKYLFSIPMLISLDLIKSSVKNDLQLSISSNWISPRCPNMNAFLADPSLQELMMTRITVLNYNALTENGVINDLNREDPTEVAAWLTVAHGLGVTGCYNYANNKTNAKVGDALFQQGKYAIRLA